MAVRFVARGGNAPILRERLRCARAVRAAKVERAKIATKLARAAGVADAYNALVATNTSEEVALDGREGRTPLRNITVDACLRESFKTRPATEFTSTRHKKPSKL